MIARLRYCAVALAALVWLSPANAETLVPAARSATPPGFDAALADAAWNGAARITQFTDLATRSAPRSQTAAAVYYDDRNVYVAFWCVQGVPLTATQTTHDVGFGSDDYVGIGIDPAGNGERAYYFEVTPLATRYAQSSENTRYRPQWSARALKTATGWNAMLVIPLAAMKISSGHRQTWRINLVRSVVATGEKLSSSFNGQMDNSAGFPNLGDVRYWTRSQPLQLTPATSLPKPTASIYTMAVAGTDRSRYVAPDTSPFSKTPRVTGIDLTIPLTATMALIGTLSPDFSNVDADQVTIAPQIYQRNLSEYRPFFAQGANYINNAATAFAVNSPPNVVFYSPSVGAIDRGLKVEGTYGAFESLGVLDVSGASAAGEPFHDIAFGWKHVLPQRTFGYWTNGAIADHGALRDSTVEAGAQARDLRSGWLGAIFGESEFTANGAERYKSSSTYGFIDHQNDSHEVFLGFRNISPRYHPADGFTEVADIRGFAAEYTRFFAHSNIDAIADRYVDASGAVHKADAGLTVARRLHADTILSFGHMQSEARSYDGDFYSGFPTYADGVTQKFDSNTIEASFHPTSPAPVDVKYSWGPFGDGFLRQFSAGGSRILRRGLGVNWDYDLARQADRSGLRTQALYRLSFAYSLAANSTLVFGVRSVTGNAAFSQPGTNVSATLHRTLANGNELYASFGTPASATTLKRFLFKYVFGISP